MHDNCWDICDCCYKELEGYGQPALRKYLYLCEHDANEQNIFTQSGDSGHGPTLVRFLEVKGFITTTEVEEDLLMILPRCDILGTAAGPVVYRYCGKHHSQKKTVTATPESHNDR